LLLPIAIRWGIPELAQSAQQFELLTSQSTEATTIAIHGNTWQYSSPQHPPRTFHLAGLKPVAPIWQNQANSVAMMLIGASQNQVDIQFLAPDSPLALVRLPNGTLLQEILLAQGIAEFDPNQKNLPVDVAHALQQAQLTAQQQHKNLWGLP
jgi:endonuclease YncB( thermonuclease family)